MLYIPYSRTHVLGARPCRLGTNDLLIRLS
jgi:hypothetical protein